MKKISPQKNMYVKCKLHTPKLFEIRRVYTLVLNFPSSTKEYFAFSLITARFYRAMLATLFYSSEHCNKLVFVF